MNVCELELGEFLLRVGGDVRVVGRMSDVDSLGDADAAWVEDVGLASQHRLSYSVTGCRVQQPPRAILVECLFPAACSDASIGRCRMSLPEIIVAILGVIFIGLELRWLDKHGHTDEDMDE